VSTRSRLVRAVATVAVSGTLAVSSAGVAAPRGQRRRPWIIDVPDGWNGTVLLYQHGLVPPGGPHPAVDASDPLSAQYLLDQGYALAGSSFATGFAADEALRTNSACWTSSRRSSARRAARSRGATPSVASSRPSWLNERRTASTAPSHSAAC
jgi:hypothetical protein